MSNKITEFIATRSNDAVFNKSSRVFTFFGISSTPRWADTDRVGNVRADRFQHFCFFGTARTVSNMGDNFIEDIVYV